VLFNRGRGNELGASLVEFALVAPLLFLLLFGVIEFARLGHGFTTVWSAAREGARHVTTVGDTNGDMLPNYLDCISIVETALDKVVGMSVGAGEVHVTYFDLSGTAVADCDLSTPLTEPAPSGSANIDNGFTIQVEVTGEFDAIVPIISGFLDGIELDSTQTRSIFMGVVGE